MPRGRRGKFDLWLCLRTIPGGFCCWHRTGKAETRARTVHMRLAIRPTKLRKARNGTAKSSALRAERNGAFPICGLPRR